MESKKKKAHGPSLRKPYAFIAHRKSDIDGNQKEAPLPAEGFMQTAGL